MRQSGMTEEIYIELTILHLISEPAMLKAHEPEDQQQKPVIDSSELAGPPSCFTFKGLVNEGTTCYINSLIQTLFFIREFRQAVYKMPSNLVYDQDTQENIPFCL